MKKGDIVWLKCGGLPMCIEVRTNDGFNCVWHDLEGRPHKEYFMEECLTLDNPLN